MTCFTTLEISTLISKPPSSFFLIREYQKSLGILNICIISIYEILIFRLNVKRSTSPKGTNLFAYRHTA